MGIYQYPREYPCKVVRYYMSKDGNKNLSAHFKVKEFQSKDGAETVVICPELIAELEKLYTYMNAKAINITSGYRTVAHSKAVGGSGATDNHHLGMAADIKVKKQDGSYYSPADVVCALQSLGWNHGIGLMKTAVHVDTGSKYWFDETKKVNGKYVQVADWYTYLGIKKPSNTVNVKPSNPVTVKPASPTGAKSYVITADWLYVRTKASTILGKKVGKLLKGERFKGVRVNNSNWYRITEGKFAGNYVCSGKHQKAV